MNSLKSKKLFLLDLDGTLYLDDALFEGPGFPGACQRYGGRYMFLTNNSSRGAEDYVAKLNKMGVACTVGDFYTSVDATLRHLAARPAYRRILRLWHEVL
jgi:ribonucleotide monophosphatase NagD (HAD superfamily)